MDMTKFMKKEGENPLDNVPVANGGYTSIFRTIGCVGDSLASGEFEAVNEKGDTVYYDAYDFSWGQVIARTAGVKVYNFSRGGMSAKEYTESFAEANGFWDEDKKCTAYIIALGVNDLINFGQEVGTTADIDLADPEKNKPTFAGYYAKIVQRYLKIEPRARFFFMTMPRSDDETPERAALCEAHSGLLYELTKVFPHSYVLDIRKYAPVYDAAFREAFYMGGHLNPLGYELTGQMVCAYIDYLVRNNPNDFRKMGFVGTSLDNDRYKD